VDVDAVLVVDVGEDVVEAVAEGFSLIGLCSIPAVLLPTSTKLVGSWKVLTREGGYGLKFPNTTILFAKRGKSLYTGVLDKAVFTIERSSSGK